MTDLKSMLRTQMTAATYDAHIAGARVIETDDVLQLVARSPQSAAWLQARLLATIEAVAGCRVEILEPVNGNQGYAEVGPALVEAANLIGQSQDDESFVRSIDFPALWFQAGGAGFDRLAKYWSRFWRVYLNQFNSRAYDLWEYLQAPDFSNQEKPPFWTPPVEYQARPLGRSLGCSPVMLTGGFRQCSVFDTSLGEGVVLEECCLVHQPSEMRENKNGDPQCRFWREGAFEVLYREGLLAIRIVGDTPRSTFYKLQVWRMLPLLSPAQVRRLPDAERRTHLEWINLRGQFKKQFDADAWHRFSAGSLVPLMAHRDEGWSFVDRYQPNPLLDSVESNTDERIDPNGSIGLRGVQYG